MKTRIYMVDDHCLIREGLRAMIQREADMEVVGEADSAAVALAQIRERVPDLVIMDAHLGEMDGIGASELILGQFPNMRILVLSGLSDVSLVNRAIQAGVNGYLLKTNAATDLIKAIRMVMTGNSCLSPEVSHALLVSYKNMLAAKSDPAERQLTGREREVLKLTAEGHRLKDIAGVLNLSVKTVESHRAKLMKKLGYSSSAELTRYAIREGISPV